MSATEMAVFEGLMDGKDMNLWIHAGEAEAHVHGQRWTRSRRKTTDGKAIFTKAKGGR